MAPCCVHSVNGCSPSPWGHHLMQSGNASGDVFPTGKNRSQSCKTDHTKVFVLVCVVIFFFN